MSQFEEENEKLKKDNGKKAEQVKILQDLIETAEKDLESEKERAEAFEKRIKDMEAKLQGKSSKEDQQTKLIEQLKAKNEQLDALLAQAGKENQDEISRLKKAYDSKLVACQNERDEYKKLYDAATAEFKEFKDE